MRIITRKDLPETLTDEVIDVLVEMAMEFPKKTFDWAEVSEVLESRGQLMLILNKVEIKKKAIEKAKEEAKSDEQKRAEGEHNRRFYETLDPKAFYGNMGEPDTPQQYKDKYGVWPPGYDNDGRKIVD